MLFCPDLVLPSVLRTGAGVLTREGSSLMRTVFIRDIVLHQDRSILYDFNSELLDVIVEVVKKFF